jgi:prolyl-tRNA editing enzyme YbaK/EbsC (Cys-tRNA(Pro) deacylase)
VARVRQALSAAGLATDVVVLGEHARTAAAAAEQLGVEVAQIANSLVFAIPAPADADAPEAARHRTEPRPSWS